VPARRRRLQYREWAIARFFCVRSEFVSTVQSDIEGRLADSEPDIEVLLAEVSGGRCLRVFIDHPEGVTLAMCERVTLLLNDLRERYSLEVSSPGSERPLTKPAHFRRFVGRRARVRTRHPRGGHAGGRRGDRRDPLRGDKSFEPDRGLKEHTRPCHAKSLRPCTRSHARRASSPRS
jgi:ribosome maturation factor RimP